MIADEIPSYDAPRWEKILDLFELACGARLTYSYITVGGLMADLTRGWLQQCEKFLGEFEPVIDDLHAVAKANEMCGRFTLDAISTSSVVAFAMECFENGLLTLEQTGGLDVRFGNATAMVELTRQIGERGGDLFRFARAASSRNRAGPSTSEARSTYRRSLKSNARTMTAGSSGESEALAICSSPLMAFS
mgnify:CR=1 FL=1